MLVLLKLVCSMQLVFISDLHLSPDTTENNQIFYTLLLQWQNSVDAVYILGDFFDYWLGDDDNNLFINTMKLRLFEVTRNTPIYYIVGNHDFAVGNRFARETGVKILRDCSVIEVAGNRILLSHGDVFCSLDKQYQRMKLILQNPLLMAILKRLPLSWRRKIKELLEHKASSEFNSKPKNIYNVVDQTVLKVATKKLANVVIHGHTHNPGKYLIPTNSTNKHGKDIIRIEIPDWVDHRAGGYVLLQDANIMLHLVSS